MPEIRRHVLEANFHCPCRRGFIGCLQAVEKRTCFAIFYCCAADSLTDAGRHQLYNNGSLVPFFHCLIISLCRLLFLALHPGADVVARLYVFHPPHGVDVGTLHAAELLPRFVTMHKFTWCTAINRNIEEFPTYPEFSSCGSQTTENGVVKQNL